MQILLDGLKKEDKKRLRVNLLVSKDAGRSYLRPTLPTNFDENDTERYSHNGYLYKLAKENYTVTLRSDSSNESLRKLDGLKWMIRAVSKDVFLQKMN